MAVEPIKIGGLMRCCIETLQERTEPGAEGEEQPCKHCSSAAVLDGGAWRWIGYEEATRRRELRERGDG